MKRIFIVNPKSGYGRGLEMSKAIEKICDEKEFDYEILYTRRPKDATDFAKLYKRGKNIIYSVGGDGTIKEVVTGLIGSKNLLGVIPGGSGNDFYKTLELQEELYFESDVGKINNEYFMNVTSFGIDAEVADRSLVMKRKRIPRTQIYNLALAETFFKYKNKDISIELDGGIKIDGPKVIVVISNGKAYGSGFKIAPNAELNDGLFDLYVVGDVKKQRIIPLILKLLKAKHESDPIITKYNVSSLIVRSPEQIVNQSDGELLYDKEFNIKILPKAVTIYNDRKFVQEVVDEYEKMKKNKKKENK